MSHVAFSTRMSMVEAMPLSLKKAGSAKTWYRGLISEKTIDLHEWFTVRQSLFSKNERFLAKNSFNEGPFARMTTSSHALWDVLKDEALLEKQKILRRLIRVKKNVFIHRYILSSVGAFEAKYFFLSNFSAMLRQNITGKGNNLLWIYRAILKCYENCMFILRYDSTTLLFSYSFRG